MHISFLIRFQTNELVSWAIFDRKGRITDSANNVPLNKVPAQKYQPVILIPSTDIILTQVAIPSKKRQKVIKAIPYALEEQLIDDVDNLHFAIGKPVSNNIPVAVIAKERIQHYLQLLQTVGFKPTILLPDLLAVSNDGWTIMYLEDIVLIRTGLLAGFAVEAENLNTMLQIAIVDNPPNQITVINNTDIIDLKTLGIPIKTAESNILNTEITELNLLQGTYRPQTNNLLRPWWLTIILCTIWGGIYVTEQIIEYQNLLHQRQELNQQITQIYREAFPESRRIVNPRVQMEQKFTALQKQNQINEVFLTNLNKMTPIFSTIPNLTIKNIRFSKKQFNIKLTVQNFQTLEKLQTSLNKLNLTVKITSAATKNQLVVSNLQISVTK